MSLNSNLATGLNLLGFNHELKGKKPVEQIEALFEYFHLAGYLEPNMLAQAVKYLAAAGHFQQPPKVVTKDLNDAVANSTKQGRFNVKVFLQDFAKQDYFTANDIVDIVTFLNQTAFDRKNMVERDQLQLKQWMVENPEFFVQRADTLGFIHENKPQAKHYIGVCVMGAATFRVQTRIEDFKNLKITYDTAWASSGASRHLKLGLDQEEAMKEVAEHYQVEYELYEKNGGKFLPITELQMMQYFLKKFCPEAPIRLVDSEAEKGHWRTTTKQGVEDIAKKVVAMIQSGEIELDEETEPRFMIIAEQPFTDRMARQAQRAFDTATKEAGIKPIIVEGCGRGLDQTFIDTPAEHLGVLPRINSAMGAMMSERFNDARHKNPDAGRDSKFIMFRDRDAAFEHYVEELMEFEFQKQLLEASYVCN